MKKTFYPLQSREERSRQTDDGNRLQGRGAEIKSARRVVLNRVGEHRANRARQKILELLLSGFRRLVKDLGVLVGHINSLPNVKEHAPLSAGASVDHGVEVETTRDHVNRAADRGCVSRLVRFGCCEKRWIVTVEISNSGVGGCIPRHLAPEQVPVRIVRLAADTLAQISQQREETAHAASLSKPQESL